MGEEIVGMLVGVHVGKVGRTLTNIKNTNYKPHTERQTIKGKRKGKKREEYSPRVVPKVQKLRRNLRSPTATWYYLGCLCLTLILN